MNFTKAFVPSQVPCCKTAGRDPQRTTESSPTYTHASGAQPAAFCCLLQEKGPSPRGCTNVTGRPSQRAPGQCRPHPHLTMPPSLSDTGENARRHTLPADQPSSHCSPLPLLCSLRWEDKLPITDWQQDPILPCSRPKKAKSTPLLSAPLPQTEWVH